jgi:hypothetical protein
MATTYKIPIQPGGPQAFTVDVFGVALNLRFSYQDAPDGGWIIDISDVDGNPLVLGQPLVTGQDLLEQYPDLGIPAVMWVATEGNPDAVPTFESLGVTAQLYAQQAA